MYKILLALKSNVAPKLITDRTTIMGTYRNLRFRAMNPIMEYGTAIDELTGWSWLIVEFNKALTLLERKSSVLQANPIRDY